MNWFVYILLLDNGTYYTGISNDVPARLKKHAKGKGSKYVRSHLPFTLVYAERAKGRSEASKREYKIKQLTKEQKASLIFAPNNICSEMSIETLTFMKE